MGKSLNVKDINVILNYVPHFETWLCLKYGYRGNGSNIILRNWKSYIITDVKECISKKQYVINYNNNNRVE